MNIKSIRNILVVLMLSFFLFACANKVSTPETSSISTPVVNNASTSVMARDGNDFEIDTLDEARISVLAERVESGQPHDNVIVFVHGRGRHPAKALEQIIPDLESENNAAVLMFHWGPSYAGPLGYPVDNAVAAGESFGKALKKFNDYKEKNEELKSVLLIHSMGNIVFESYMEKYHEEGSLDSKLFDTIILNSADVDAKGHDTWVNKIDFTDNLYITVNKNDPILRFAAIHNRQKRLGKNIKKKVDLSGKANYVNFDKVDVNHRYYLHAGQNKNCYIKSFYEAVLSGNPIDLSDEHGFEKGDRDGVYVFKSDGNC